MKIYDYTKYTPLPELSTSVSEPELKVTEHLAKCSNFCCIGQIESFKNVLGIEYTSKNDYE